MFYSIVSLRKIQQFFAILAALTLIFAPLSQALAVANPGSVWTTTGSCGTPQNVNSYEVGQHVYINGSNFAANTQYAWSIKPAAGGVNAIAIASGQITSNGSGAFCFDAITLTQPNIGGPYKVDVNGKNDNFSVVAGTPTPVLCLDDAATNYRQEGTCTYVCPEGFSGEYPNCIAPTPVCQEGYIGAYPNCIAPEVPVLCSDEDATNYGVEGVCTYVCPQGFSGEYPNCIAPTPVCQEGYTGIYPNCEPVVITCQDDAATNFGEEGVCTYQNPETQVGECEFEGHKYDVSGHPLSNWKIGLMKVVSSTDSSNTYDLVDSVTDQNGYYCLEWDGYTNTPTDLPEPHSFLYRVYEVLQNGWKNISIEKGTKANNEANLLTVVDNGDILTEGGRTSVQVGDTNGYVYADAAYHVDFYNKQDETGGETRDTYKLFGTVWHDTDEDDIIDESEDNLTNWTVRAVNASNSEDVYTDETDEDGGYELNVPAGKWIISELTEDGWVLISEADGNGTHTVTVPAPEVMTLMNWLIPTAEAASLGSFGAYNFGNILSTTTATTTDGSTSSHHRHRSSSNNSGQILGDSTTATNAPIGEVLGASTTTMPVGAPNTGAGGTSATPTSAASFAMILAPRSATRKTK